MPQKPLWQKYSKEELQKIADESCTASEFWFNLGYQSKNGSKHAWKVVEQAELVVNHWAKQKPAIWRQYSAGEIKKKALEATNEADFLRKVGYSNGDGHSAMKLIRSEIGIDTSHWRKYASSCPSTFPDGNGNLLVEGKTYTKAELQNICNSCRSYRQLAAAIGCNENNDLCKQGKKIVKRFQLDCSHFTGQSWNKGNFDLSRFRNYTNDPKNKPRTRSLYDALEQLRGHKCENPQCGASEHCGKPIPLEIHHKDGNRFNNTLENLILLCPTCHAMTDNYRGRNTKPEEQVTDEEFVAALKSSANIKEAIDSIGGTIQGSMYNRARRLIAEHDIEHLRLRDEMYALVRNQDKEQNHSYKNARSHIFALIDLCLLYPTNDNLEKLFNTLQKFIDTYSKDNSVTDRIHSKKHH